MKTLRLLGMSLRCIGPLATVSYAIARMVGTETMAVSIRGWSIVIRPRSPDLKVALNSLNGEFDVVADLLGRDFSGLIIDAGGYIGTSALAFADLFPRAHIVVVEPSHENLALLRRNVGANPRIAVVNAALAPEAGADVTLKDRGKGQWGFTVVDTLGINAETTAMHLVETTSVAEIIDKNQGLDLGLVKLDVEGAEKELFEKAGSQLAEARVVIAELHDRFMDGCTDAFNAFSTDRTTLACGHEKYLSLTRDVPHGDAGRPASAAHA